MLLTRECEDTKEILAIRIPDKDPIDCEIEFNSCIARLPSPGTVDIVTNSFNSVQKIKFSKYDADGAKHEWTDVAVGQIIDIFNDDDDSYFVGEITAIDNSNANLVLLTVDKVQAKGNAVGAARIKVFTLNNEIDELTNYVRKTGDQMTGTLETTGRILIRPGDTGAKGANNMLVVNQLTSNGSGSILRVQQDNTDIIKVQDDRTTTFNFNRITEVGAPTDGDDAATRQYVDDAVAAVQGGVSGGLFEPTVWTLDLSLDRDAITKGTFYADDDDFYMSTSNANNLTWVPGAAGGRTTNAWVTIYSTTGKLMHTYEVNKIYFKEKYGKKYITEFEWAWHYKSNNLVDGDQYRIIVPGFLT